MMNKTIFITQRSTYHKLRNESVDSLDQAFHQLLSEDLHLIPISSESRHIEKMCEDFKPDGMIFSGGNSLMSEDKGFSPSRITCEGRLLDYARNHACPVLGICYGMQFMNHAEGGTLEKQPHHVNNDHNILIGEMKLTVNSFHNYTIPPHALGKNLTPFATADDNTIEGFCHNNYPWLGMMWHPERAIAHQNVWTQFINDFFHRKIECTPGDIVHYFKTNIDSNDG